MEDILGLLILMSGLLMLPIRRIKNNIMLLSLQAFSLSIMAFAKGLMTIPLEYHSIIIGFLTLIVKVIVLPLILLKQANRLKVKEEKTMRPVTTIIIGVLIVMFTYGYIEPILLQEIVVGKHLLAAAVATILFGCFIVVSRSCVLNQILGIIVMENGLFLSALAITGGMPMAVELGIFFDVLVGVLVMGMIVYKINDRFHSLDSQELNRLRG